MITFDEVYKNVEKGFNNASEHVKIIYLNEYSRIIMEACLLDEETPLELYKSLFGFDKRDVEEYRYYFFNIPENTPRIFKYGLYYSIDSEIFSNEPEDIIILRANLYKNVLDHGWRYIDNEYNKGSLFSFDETIKPSVAFILHKLNDNLMQTLQSDPNNLSKIEKFLSLLGKVKRLYTPPKEDKDDGKNKLTQLQLLFQDDEEGSKDLIVGLNINKEYKLIENSQETNKEIKEILSNLAKDSKKS